jgi:hypothetical protein
MDTQDILPWHEYFAGAKNILLRECCVNEEAIQKATQDGINSHENFTVLSLNTSGQNDILAKCAGYNTLLKSVFLMNPEFRKNVIGYYRTMGYDWVDIISLNRDHWKIFLWKNYQHKTYQANN